MNNAIVTAQDDSSQHDDNTKDDISISSVILSGVEGAEAPRYRQGSVILVSTDSNTNEEQQTRRETTTIHHDSSSTPDSDQIPLPLPPHTIIPTANLQSIINDNLTLCSYCKKGKQRLVTCNSSCFATTLRIECVSCEKQKKFFVKT